MKNRTRVKTVEESVEEKKGLFGSLKSILFKKKDRKNKTKFKVKVLKQLTKNGKIRKQTVKTTEEQVKKLFRIHAKNPNLSTCDIARTVGMSDELVKYYITKGKKASLQGFKPKKINGKKQKSKTLVTKLSNKKAQTNLEKLYKKEKYPVEHQGDPDYFKGSDPPQVVATVEAFKDQKRRNNINRAVVAKKISIDKKVTEEQAHEDKRKARLREKHQTHPPKIHLTPCPSCNPKSNLSVDEYNTIVRQESYRRKLWSDNQKKLTEKEKELDKQKQKQEGTVAEQAQQGTQLCRKCDNRIPYSQATRTFSIYGEYYCSEHEPKIV